MYSIWVVTYVDQEAEGSPPGKAEDDIHWPMHKGPREGYEPYQRKEHGQGRHHLGVNETALRPRRCMAVLVKVLARHTGDDGSEDELCGPQDDVDDAIKRHCCNSFGVACLVAMCYTNALGGQTNCFNRCSQV